MARCPKCTKTFVEPPGEEGDHPCPHCGMSPENWHDYLTRDAAVE